MLRPKSLSPHVRPVPTFRRAGFEPRRPDAAVGTGDWSMDAKTMSRTTVLIGLATVGVLLLAAVPVQGSFYESHDLYADCDPNGSEYYYAKAYARITVGGHLDHDLNGQYKAVAHAEAGSASDTDRDENLPTQSEASAYASASDTSARENQHALADAKGTASAYYTTGDPLDPIETRSTKWDPDPQEAGCGYKAANLPGLGTVRLDIVIGT